MRIPTFSRVFLGALYGLALSASEVEAALQTTLTFWIQSSQQLPNPNVLPPTTHATLSSLHASYDAPLTTSGTFVFRNVTSGSYLADVHCSTHSFAPLRVEFGQEKTSATELDGTQTKSEALRAFVSETYRGNDWGNKGLAAPKMGGENSFALRVLGAKEYYTERGSFSVFGILKNPMILMGLVSMVLFLGVPKLVENMDPEMRAEWEEQQKSNPMSSLMGGGQQPGANPMGNFDMAAYLAGQGNKKDEGEPVAGGNNNGGGKKGGKR